MYIFIQVHAVANRCARLKLKVQADAPILILPRKTTCPDILVANLGKLHIENQFLHSSDPNTNGFSFIASRSRANCSDNNEDGMFLLCFDILILGFQFCSLNSKLMNSYIFILS